MLCLDEEGDEESEKKNPPKNRKFKVDKKVVSMIELDSANKQLWEEVKDAAKDGYQVTRICCCITLNSLAI